jgi:hypothetical protein
MRAIRVHRCESQEGMARHGDLTLDTVRRLETGWGLPSLDTLYRIAWALEVPPGVLLAGGIDRLRRLLGCYAHQPVSAGICRRDHPSGIPCSQ